MAAAAALIAVKLPATARDTKARPSKRLRFNDPRLRLYLLCSFGGFTGFAGLQQTLGFRLQDMLSLSGTETAQYTGFALMVAALFSFSMQLLVAARFQGRPITLIRCGVALLFMGALVIAIPGSFTMVLVGMACLGAGLGLRYRQLPHRRPWRLSRRTGRGGRIGHGLPGGGLRRRAPHLRLPYQHNPTMSALGAAAILFVVVFAAAKMRGNR